MVTVVGDPTVEETVTKVKAVAIAKEIITDVGTAPEEGEIAVEIAEKGAVVGGTKTTEGITTGVGMMVTIAMIMITIVVNNVVGVTIATTIATTEIIMTTIVITIAGMVHRQGLITTTIAAVVGVITKERMGL